MEDGLVYGAYGAYAAAGLGALAVYAALPKQGRRDVRGAALILGALALGGLVAVLRPLLGASADRFYFFILSLMAVGSAARVATHPRPVYSAMYFVLVVLSTAALTVLAGAQFLAAALVIVYAGAILVTYVFVIMLAQQSTPGRGGLLGDVLDYDRNAREPVAAVLAGFVLAATIAGVIVGRPWSASTVVEPPAGNTLTLGRLLLSEFAVSVELAGVLLMVAMIGAIAIARKRVPEAQSGQEEPPPGQIGREVEPF